MRLFGDYLHDDLQSMSSEAFLAAVRSAPDANDPFRGVLAEQLQGDSAEKVVGIVLEYLKSEEFREEINRRVPPPNKEESEQEFVERANTAIKAVLDEKYLRGGGGRR